VTDGDSLEVGTPSWDAEGAAASAATWVAESIPTRDAYYAVAVSTICNGQVAGMRNTVTQATRQFRWPTWLGSRR